MIGKDVARISRDTTGSTFTLLVTLTLESAIKLAKPILNELIKHMSFKDFGMASSSDIYEMIKNQLPQDARRTSAIAAITKEVFLYYAHILVWDIY
jgi:hypothetical protein